MTPDSTLNRAFFVVQSPSVAIESFNQMEFSLIGSLLLSGVTGNPRHVVRWGTNGLAFNTDGGQPWLIGGNFVH
jgi:hypothetical protein